MSQLSNDDWRALIEIARQAISSAVLEHRLPDLSFYPPSLQISRGAFVTLHLQGKLRGCVGQIEGSGPLADTVARSAINAALHDPRFPPVSPTEINFLEIEISILSALERIAPEEIVVGRHGLVVVCGANRGLLLPQVAAERNWSSQRFLEETCRKAGLWPDTWKNPETLIYAFTAELYLEMPARTSPGM
jgi:AmmeMemoRadiSam system protein A